VGAGDLDMALATVGITKVKRENTTMIEADKKMAVSTSVLLVKKPRPLVTFDVYGCDQRKVPHELL
jgi:hypothetical protein